MVEDSIVDVMAKDDDKDSGYGKVVTLSRDNYQRWRIELKDILMAKQLWSIATDASAVVAVPASGANADEYNKYLVKDAKARSLIRKTLDDVTFNHVRDCDTSKDMLDRITELREPKSTDVMMTELSEFFKVQWSESDDVSSFLASLVVMQAKINACSVNNTQVITETLVIGKMLTSLPSRFDHFIESWHMVGTKTSTLKDFREKLLLAERNQKRGEVPAIEGDALFSKGHKKRSRAGDKRSSEKPFKADKEEVICFNCNKPGHISRHCPEKKKGD